jgi:hypothetical protein
MGLHHRPRRGLAALVALSGASVSAWAQVEPERADGPVATFRGHRVIQVQAKTVRDYQTVLALTDDVWTHSPRLGRPVDIRVSPEQFVAVVAAGLKYKILVDDVQAWIDTETAEIQRIGAGDDPAWYLNYHNYTDNKAYVQAMAAAYPTLCTYQVIGQSLQGREIFAIRITGPGSTANRPASLWFGGQHAREWVNVAVPEYHAEQLLTRYATDPHVRHLVDHHEFIFVPIMNPDGYDYTWTNNRLWRKNRRPNNNNPNTGCATNFGVDLNRNWGHQWGPIAGGGSSGSCSNDTYRGVAAFSEPETQVIRDFVIANPRIQSMMDWHSYGQYVMSPWGYTSALPTPQSVADMYQALTDNMAAAILSVHGRVYESGPLQPTLYQANGVSVDWAWGSRQILGLTIELRAGGASGFELPPGEITPTCEETWPAFLVIADHLTPPPTCYANCDGTTTTPQLSANDFSCFLNAYASGLSSANCDGSTVEPVLTANDFSCFLNEYANGCS